MSSEVYARVVFQSPLPALDREFDYLVPSAVAQDIAVGCRVKVPFAGQQKEGLVVALSSEPSYSGKLSAISEVVSSIPVLQPHVYSVLKMVATRQCCSVGELLDSAVPKRSVRIEKNFDFQASGIEPKGIGVRTAKLIRPVFDSKSGRPNFTNKLAELASESIAAGRSAIICVPDFRDLKVIQQALLSMIPVDQITVVDSSEVGSKRYEQFLAQLSGKTQVVLGTRSVIYSPVSATATLIVWDDGDQSHQDQQAPYLTTREIALIRQSLFDCELHFVSHARSTEVQRLVEIGYLSEEAIENWRPKVSISDGKGLDGAAFKAIKNGLESGPVLFQVAAPGKAQSLYCSSCNERSRCKHCNGPLWLNAKGQVVCRWCGQFNLDFACQLCGDKKLRQGSAGATRWVEQLGKSFPGVVVREVQAGEEIVSVSGKPAIVVATAGIEPAAEGGYAAVVFVDCVAQLARDSLRAPEDALRAWLNALAFMRADGHAVAVGVSDEVSRALSLGEVVQTVSTILAEREELGFPPARRILSATGSLETVNSLATQLRGISGTSVLGIATAKSNTDAIDHRLLVSFTYSSGNTVATEVKKFLFTLSSKSNRTSSKSGRAIRPLTIKFDDPRVL
jgi:primosomal protein N' (replication factor Y)